MPLYVYRPSIQNTTLMVDKAFNLQSNIGGCCGGCTTPSTSSIFFEKSEFYPGESTTAKIICDNSACEKDISYFKFNLVKTITGSDNYNRWRTVFSSLPVVARENGIIRGEKVERNIQFTIPLKDRFPEWQLGCFNPM